MKTRDATPSEHAAFIQMIERTQPLFNALKPRSPEFQSLKAEREAFMAANGFSTPYGKPLQVRP